MHLVLGHPDDPHATAVLAAIRARGRDAFLFTSSAFPSQARLTLSPHSLSGGRLDLPDGACVPLAKLRSVYWRTYDPPHVAPLPDPMQTFIAGNDARGLLESFMLGTSAKWVNSFEAYSLHRTKPRQLQMVAALGVPIPRTIVTNDPDAVRTFAASHGQVIFKPVQGGAHAERLTGAQLEAANLESLRVSPVTLQEEIWGTSIRAFVVGSRVLACAIESPFLDFRDDPSPRIVPYPVSQELSDTCLRIAKTLGLCWTGIDFRLDSADAPVFLEANPSPMFLGFEERTGLPLLDSLVDLLVE